MKKKTYVRFCPKCGSTDVELLDSHLLAGGIPSQYTCNNCSFTGYLFPEKEIE